MREQRLAILVIHDSSFPFESEVGILETEDLVLCKIGERHYVSEWESVCSILANERQIMPRPDLILIDARFEKDKSAPDLGLLTAHVDSGEVADPRGLLYGAMIAAQFGGLGSPPFGFEIYSQDLGSIAKDPYALTFYGLLSALAGDHGPSDRGLTFASEMQATPSGLLPRHSWGSALKHFRKSLISKLGRSWSPDYSSFADARNAIRTLVDKGTVPPETLSVRWWTEDGTLRTVLLSSLLADCRRQPEAIWDREALHINRIPEELEQIMKRGAFLSDVRLQLMEMFIELYRADGTTWDNPDRNIAVAAGDSETVKWVLAIAFIALRALNLFDRSRDKSIRLLDALPLIRLCPVHDFEQSSLENTMGRALSYVLLGGSEKKVSAAQVLDMLGAADGWPARWNLDARAMIISILESLADDHKNWPEWITIESP